MRRSLYDRSLDSNYMSEAGPFTTVQKFNDWFATLCIRWVKDPESLPPYSFRKDLPDDCDCVFTHRDLHPSNIMMSSEQPHRILAVVDWEQSGWLPEYWEHCKAQFTALYKDEWTTKYRPVILDQPQASPTEA